MSPVRASIAATSSAPFVARRVASVASTCMVSTAIAPAMAAKRATAATAASIARTDRRPSGPIPDPRATRDFSLNRGKGARDKSS